MKKVKDWLREVRKQQFKELSVGGSGVIYSVNRLSDNKVFSIYEYVNITNFGPNHAIMKFESDLIHVIVTDYFGGAITVQINEIT